MHGMPAFGGTSTSCSAPAGRLSAGGAPNPCPQYGTPHPIGNNRVAPTGPFVVGVHDSATTSSSPYCILRVVCRVADCSFHPCFISRSSGQKPNLECYIEGFACTKIAFFNSARRVDLLPSLEFCTCLIRWHSRSRMAGYGGGSPSTWQGIGVHNKQKNKESKDCKGILLMVRYFEWYHTSTAVSFMCT